MQKKKTADGAFLLHHPQLRPKLVHRCRVHGPVTALLPLIFLVSACLLLLLALLSFLSPSPSAVHGHAHGLLHVRIIRHRGSLSSDRLGQELEAGAVTLPPAGFHVPSSGGSLGHDPWSSMSSSFYRGCSNASSRFLTADRKTQPNRYLLIATSGGLNQQRTGIIDAVVAAYILNATLVVPKLDQESFWKDASQFEDIFDVDWFILFLSRDVEIIRELPKEGGKLLVPHLMRVPRKCTPKCYKTRVLPIFNRKQAIQLGKFDYRLANKLERGLQKLRCRANFHALKFTDPIREMGKTLVERMRSKGDRFIALHLRFEPDMLAFSGCYYGGGDKERQDLGELKKRWKNLRKDDPEKERRQGRCPLTPEEVGLMLRALGYGSDVHLYVASGDVYGGEETLAPLKAMFPNYHTKETLASKAELAPFSSYSSRMAALDFIVCDESSLFATNNNGNMARILAGRRRYFGHKPTIRPNAKKLNKLFMNRTSMTWEEFGSKVRHHQIGYMGDPNEIKPGTGEFHENPSACICEKQDNNLIFPRKLFPGDSEQEEDNNYQNSTGEFDNDDEQESSDDTDYVDYTSHDAEGRQKPNGLRRLLTDILKSDQQELEDYFSD